MPQIRKEASKTSFTGPQAHASSSSWSGSLLTWEASRAAAHAPRAPWPGSMPRWTSSPGPGPRQRATVLTAASGDRARLWPMQVQAKRTERQVQVPPRVSLGPPHSGRHKGPHGEEHTRLNNQAGACSSSRRIRSPASLEVGYERPPGCQRSKTTCPPTTVSITRASRIVSGGTRVRSRSMRARSASLPGSSVPFSCSSKDAWAPPSV
jgi:hypothetical protein